MKTWWSVIGVVSCLMLFSSSVVSQEVQTPKGIATEQSLPGRHRYVVQDILKLCKPERGFWVDLGAGKGQIAIPLIEATGNPVVMLDPSKEAMIQGLETARQKGIEKRRIQE